jgi:hypothetical protein
MHVTVSHNGLLGLNHSSGADLPSPRMPPLREFLVAVNWRRWNRGQVNEGNKSHGLAEFGMRSAARGPFPDYETKPIIAFSAN